MTFSDLVTRTWSLGHLDQLQISGNMVEPTTQEPLSSAGGNLVSWLPCPSLASECLASQRQGPGVWETWTDSWTSGSIAGHQRHGALDLSAVGNPEA